MRIEDREIIRYGKAFDRLASYLLVFIAGLFLGYLWMSKAYGLW